MKQFVCTINDNGSITIHDENGDNGVSYNSNNVVAREIVVDLTDAGMLETSE